VRHYCEILRSRKGDTPALGELGGRNVPAKVRGHTCLKVPGFAGMSPLWVPIIVTVAV